MFQAANTKSTVPDASSFTARIDAWRLRWHGLEFAIQGMLATALAFYAAISFDLEAPYSAAITVWVVASVRPGHVISKGFYRVVGTLIGGAFAVVLIASLDSMPVLLFGLLALWIGVCTGIGNLFRHFRTYAGVLAGYTAAFVVVGAKQHPDFVLDVALDRMAGIVIGVLSASLISALIGSRRSGKEIEESLRKIQADLLEAIPRRWDLRPDELQIQLLRLSREYATAEALLEYADLESPGFRRRAHRLRVLTGMLMDFLDSSRVAGAESGQVFEEINSALRPVFLSLDEKSLSAASLELRSIISRLETSDRPEMDRPIAYVLSSWVERLTGSGLDRVKLPEPLDPDYHGAIRHCIRTTLALGLAGGFWALTGWQNGSSFFMLCAAVCALASTMNHPARAVVMMTWSILIASISGFFCKFYLLPYAGDLPTMLICLAVVIVPLSCLIASRRPTLMTIGATGGLFSLALIQPANHMVYDPASYLSFAISGVFGTLFGAPIFFLILPTRPEREGGRLLKRLMYAAAANRTKITPPSLHEWRMSANDLLRQMQANPGTTDAELAAALRAAELGLSYINLRSTRLACSGSDENGRYFTLSQQHEIERLTNLNPIT